MRPCALKPPAIAGPVEDSDAHFHRREGGAVEAALLRELLVHLRQRYGHVLGGVAGMNRMLAIIQRRVPIGHEAVAAEGADGAAMLQRRIDEWRHRCIDEAREIRRIVTEGLRQIAIATQSAGQTRHHAGFAAEFEQRRIARNPVQRRLRQKSREGIAQAATRRQNRRTARGHPAAPAQGKRERRGRSVDQQMHVGEHQPAEALRRGDGSQGHRASPQDRKPRHQHEDRRARNRKENQLRQIAGIFAQRLAEQHVLQRFGMNVGNAFHAGRRRDGFTRRAG